MPNGRLRKAVDISIKSAVDSGKLDLDDNAAPIAMLRYMCDFLDGNQDDAAALKAVTPASFLSYCDALGLTPSEQVETKPSGSKLAVMVSGSKFAKAANG